MTVNSKVILAVGRASERLSAGRLRGRRGKTPDCLVGLAGCFAEFPSSLLDATEIGSVPAGRRSVVGRCLELQQVAFDFRGVFAVLERRPAIGGPTFWRVAHTL
jgi:hypothetical protein